MTYTEAVQLALDGNDRGYGFLYQNTYKEKLYLALQYMKNQADAEDVLQDAYVKAFSNLKSLKDPEKFSSWLGQIVANTAKNALVKKNPVLFTDLPADEEEEESYEERIPDEDVSTQPELSYTREETRQMVQEMIDSLSDEQRVCILMYHMEDMSIKEIAETLDCSESTVKSRLNYGRKNLKAKAEEMQKKGYKLYSLAPLALLLLLLHTDAKAMETEPSFTAAGRQISTDVLDEIHGMPQGGVSGAEEAEATGAAGETAETGEEAAGEAAEAGAAARTGFLGTTAGKAVAVVVAVAVVGGAAFGISRLVQNNRNGVAEEEYAEQEEPAAAVPEPETEEEEEETPEEVAVTKDMYPDLLEGGLSEDQFEVALAYAPAEMENGEIDKDYLLSMIDDICYDFPDLCFDGTYDNSSDEAFPHYIISLDKANQFLSVLTDHTLSESDMQGWDINGLDISGDTVDVTIFDGEWMTPYANITDAVLWEDSMVVTYEIRSTGTAGYYPEGTGTRSAVLTQTEDGRYRVNRIVQGTSEEIYHTERQNLLTVDEDGWTDERMYYDLVSLEGTNDAHQAINDGLAADYQNYLSYSERVTGMTSAQIAASDIVDYHQVGAGVSNIQDGVFSVRFMQTVMAEELATRQYGLTYSLKTGEQLGIRDLTDLTDEELLSRIKTALRDYLSDFSYTGSADINSYTLDDIGSGINFLNSARLSFCVQDDEIYILVPPMEFFDDVWSNHAVPTGIYISGAEENEIEAGAQAEEETEEYGYDEDYVFPDSDSRYISRSELAGLTDDELRIARNEIYARHGRRFNDPTLQAYFDSKNWYNGTIEADDFNDGILNDYETANALLIHDYEEER